MKFLSKIMLSTLALNLLCAPVVNAWSLNPLNWFAKNKKSNTESFFAIYGRTNCTMDIHYSLEDLKKSISELESEYSSLTDEKKKEVAGEYNKALEAFKKAVERLECDSAYQLPQMDETKTPGFLKRLWSKRLVRYGTYVAAPVACGVVALFAYDQLRNGGNWTNAGLSKLPTFAGIKNACPAWLTGSLAFLKNKACSGFSKFGSGVKSLFVKSGSDVKTPVKTEAPKKDWKKLLWGKSVETPKVLTEAPKNVVKAPVKKAPVKKVAPKNVKTPKVETKVASKNNVKTPVVQVKTEAPKVKENSKGSSLLNWFWKHWNPDGYAKSLVEKTANELTKKELDVLKQTEEKVKGVLDLVDPK